MKKAHKILAFANLAVAIIGGGYFLWTFGQFTSYSPQNDITAIIITLVIMIAIGYVARTHWKISQTEDPKKTLKTLSIINVTLFIFGWLSGSSCDEFECAVLIPISGLLLVSFIITLVTSIKLNYKSQLQNGVKPRWPKLILKISVVGIIIWAILYALMIIT